MISWVSSYPSSTNKNIRSIAYLLDIDLWNTQYKDSTYGAYAIGEPTIELFCKSYKDTHPERYIECANTDNYGYNVKWSDEKRYGTDISRLPTSVDCKKIFRNYGIYVIPGNSNAYACWFASQPASYEEAMFYMDYEGKISCVGYDIDFGLGVRPVVCLQSGIQLVSNGDGTYRLSK